MPLNLIPLYLLLTEKKCLPLSLPLSVEQDLTSVVMSTGNHQLLTARLLADVDVGCIYIKNKPSIFLIYNHQVMHMAGLGHERVNEKGKRQLMIIIYFGCGGQCRQN